MCIELNSLELTLKMQELENPALLQLMVLERFRDLDYDVDQLAY